jgi:hypothetical protein
MRISIITYIGIALSLTACFTDTITPSELGNYRDKMVVNGVLSNNGPIALEITDSKSSFSGDLPGLVRGAEVQLAVNQDVEDLTFDIFDEVYTGSSTIAPGDAVTLTVFHPDYPRIQATARIPDDIDATAILTVDGGVDTSGLVSDLLSVSFKDHPIQENYYRINFYYRNEAIDQYIPFAFNRNDPSLADFNSYRLNDGSILFSDELFNGDEKTLTAVPVSGIVAGNTGDKYMIELSSISKDYFEYYRSLQRAEDAKEITFQAGYNNAVVIHTNIAGGLGILGAENANQLILR